jgi:hypothetical protein
MAVIKIADNKTNLPAIVKVTVGRQSSFYKVKSTEKIYNKPVI